MNTVRFTFGRECIHIKVIEVEVEELNKELNPCNNYKLGKNFGPAIYSRGVRRADLIHTLHVA
jgi:hypothetical protein